jgi:UDP-glucose 4-epimerase
LWNAYRAKENLSERSHVVSDFIYQALQKQEIRLLTNGEEERQFIHVHDICTAIQQILLKNDTHIYDITSNEWIQIKEIAQIISSYLHVDCILGEEKGKTYDVKIEGFPSYWKPSIPLIFGIEQTIEICR